MEQVKRVGHEMESTGNSVGWKGDDMGKVRKASMQVLEKRWHVIRSIEETGKRRNRESKHFGWREAIR